MGRKVAPLLPDTAQGLRRLGLGLRLARLRRRVSAMQAAERAGMTRTTLRKVEHGDEGVTIGAYLAVMQVLGVENDFLDAAQSDAIGRELQDAQLLAQHGRRIQGTPSGLSHSPHREGGGKQTSRAGPPTTADRTRDWTRELRTVDEFADLITRDKTITE